MSRDLRFYYEGKWYRSEGLFEGLFQFLTGDARPPDYERNIPLSGIRSDRKATTDMMYKRLRFVNDSIDHWRWGGVLETEVDADLRPHLYSLCDEIFGYGDRFFDALPAPPPDCPLKIPPYRNSTSPAVQFKDVPVYKIGSEMEEIISAFKSRSAMVIEQLCECP